MNFVTKMEKVHKCFEAFKNNSNSKEITQFVDLFSPMFYQRNKYRLEISVGKKISGSQFSPWLSNVIHDFTVTPDCWEEDEPQLIIKEVNHNNAVALLNLAAINNLIINTEENKGVKFCRYNVYFNYNNEIDYYMSLAIKGV